MDPTLENFQKVVMFDDLKGEILEDEFNHLLDQKKISDDLEKRVILKKTLRRIGFFKQPAPPVRPPSPPKLLWKFLDEEAFKEMPVKRFMEGDHPYGAYYVTSNTLAQVGSDTSEETLANKFVIVRRNDSQPSPSLSDFPAPHARPSSPPKIPEKNPALTELIQHHCALNDSFQLLSPAHLTKTQTENHNQLGKDSLKQNISMIEGVLLDLSGLSFVQHHQKSKYRPRSKYVSSDLPCAIGNPEVLDLRLLPGDLNDPAKQTEVVKLILSKMCQQDRSAYADVSLLLGGHAVGKTKTIFDLAIERFSIILDFSAERQGQEDIKEMMKCIAHKIGFRDEFKTQLQFEESCALELLITYCARHIALELYLAAGMLKSPEEWRDLQLNGLATSSYADFLELIRKYVRFHCQTFDDAMVLTRQLTIFRWRKSGVRPILALDEANTLLNLYTNTFEKATKEKTSLWYLVGTTFGGIFGLALVIAGTRIRLRDTSIIYSPTVKKGVAAGQDLTMYTQFRFLSKEDKLSLLERLFTTELNKDVRDLIATTLPGRGRFITTFVEQLEESSASDDPKREFEVYLKDLVGGDASWTLKSQLKKLCEAHTNGEEELCRIVRIALVQDGLIKAPEVEPIDWLAGGLCHASQVPGDNIQYHIDEPLVITAIQEFLRSKDVSLAHYFSIQLFEMELLDATALGYIFELVVLSSLLEGGSFSTITDAIGINRIDSSSIKNISVHSYEDWLQYGWYKQTALHPAKALGFDGACFASTAHVAFGNKTTYRENQSVDSRHVTKNDKTTRLENIYSAETTDEQKKRAILDRRHTAFQILSTMAQGGLLTQMFRVHFIMPSAPTLTSAHPAKHPFRAGTIHISKIALGGNVLDEITVDIDTSCLQLCGLFSNKTLDVLEKRYPVKNLKRRTKWKVIKDEGDPREILPEQISADSEVKVKKQRGGEKGEESDVVPMNE